MIRSLPEFRWKKIVASATAASVLYGALAVPVLEAKLWDERRQAAESAVAESKAKAEPLQLAQLSAGIPSRSSVYVAQSLNALPGAAPALDLGNLMYRLPASFAGSVPVGSRTLANLAKSLPLLYGSLRKFSPGAPGEGAPGRVAVLIQDAHRNTDAQRSIAGAIGELIRDRQIGLIALEGSFGPQDLSRYRSFPNPSTVRKVSDFLLKNHKISGPVHAALTIPGPLPYITGIDDPSHYQAHLEAYRRTSALSEETGMRLSALAAQAEAEKGKVFGKELMDFDRLVQGYGQRTVALGKYVRAVRSYGAADAPEIGRFLQAYEMETTLDFKQVEKERSELVKRLTVRLSQSQLSDLLRASVAHRLGQSASGEYYSRLRGACEKSGLDLARFPAMEKYIRYVSLSDRIDAEKLFEELKAGENAAYAKLALTAPEKNLASRSRFLALAGKLVRYSLGPSEWLEYRSAKPDFEKNLAGLDLSAFEAFNREAEIRDRLLAENFIREMDARGAASAAIVAGGYHAPGITRILNQRGISVLSFVPRIGKVDAESGAQYLGAFNQEKTPLEKLFASPKITIAQNPFAAFEADDGSFPLLAAADAAWTGGDAESAFKYFGRGLSRFKVKVQRPFVTVVAQPASNVPAVETVVEFSPDEPGAPIRSSVSKSRWTPLYAASFAAALAVISLAWQLDFVRIVLSFSSNALAPYLSEYFIRYPGEIAMLSLALLGVSSAWYLQSRLGYVFKDVPGDERIVPHAFMLLSTGFALSQTGWPGSEIVRLFGSLLVGSGFIAAAVLSLRSSFGPGGPTGNGDEGPSVISDLPDSSDPNIQNFWKWRRGAWAEISGQEPRSANAEGDKLWGLNFFQGALYPGRVEDSRIALEFPEGSFEESLGSDMPPAGAIYTKLYSSFRYLWRAVDFAAHPPSRAFVRGADAEQVRERFLREGLDIPVEVWPSEVLSGAYYHSFPIEALDSALEQGAIISLGESSYRAYLMGVLSARLLGTNDYRSLSPEQRAGLRRHMREWLAHLENPGRAPRGSKVFPGGWAPGIAFLFAGPLVIAAAAGAVALLSSRVRFSNPQRRVIGKIENGLTDFEIARELNLSRGNVHDALGRIAAVLGVAAGQVRGALVDRGVIKNPHPELNARILGFTRLQHEILKRVAAGGPNAIVAKRVKTSERYVSETIRKAERRLGLPNQADRAELIAAIRRANLITAERSANHETRSPGALSFGWPIAIAAVLSEGFGIPLEVSIAIGLASLAFFPLYLIWRGHSRNPFVFLKPPSADAPRVPSETESAPETDAAIDLSAGNSDRPITMIRSESDLALNGLQAALNRVTDLPEEEFARLLDSLESVEFQVGFPEHYGQDISFSFEFETEVSAQITEALLEDLFPGEKKLFENWKRTGALRPNRWETVKSRFAARMNALRPDYWDLENMGKLGSGNLWEIRTHNPGGIYHLNSASDWAQLKGDLKRIQDELPGGFYSIHIHIGHPQYRDQAKPDLQKVNNLGKIFEAHWRALAGMGYRESSAYSRIVPMSLDKVGKKWSTSARNSMIHWDTHTDTLEIKILGGLLQNRGGQADALDIDALAKDVWWTFALFDAVTNPDRNFPLAMLPLPVLAGEKPNLKQTAAFADIVFGDDLIGKAIALKKLAGLRGAESGAAPFNWGHSHYGYIGLKTVYELHQRSDGWDKDLTARILQDPRLLADLRQELLAHADRSLALSYYPEELQESFSENEPKRAAPKRGSLFHGPPWYERHVAPLWESPLIGVLQSYAAFWILQAFFPVFATLDPSIEARFRFVAYALIHLSIGIAFAGILAWAHRKRGRDIEWYDFFDLHFRASVIAPILGLAFYWAIPILPYLPPILAEALAWTRTAALAIGLVSAFVLLANRSVSEHGINLVTHLSFLVMVPAFAVYVLLQPFWLAGFAVLFSGTAVGHAGALLQPLWDAMLLAPVGALGAAGLAGELIRAYAWGYIAAHWFRHWRDNATEMNPAKFKSFWGGAGSGSGDHGRLIADFMANASPMEKLRVRLIALYARSDDEEWNRGLNLFIRFWQQSNGGSDMDVLTPAYVKFYLSENFNSIMMADDEILKEMKKRLSGEDFRKFEDDFLRARERTRSRFNEAPAHDGTEDVAALNRESALGRLPPSSQDSRDQKIRKFLLEGSPAARLRIRLVLLYWKNPRDDFNRWGELAKILKAWLENRPGWEFSLLSKADMEEFLQLSRGTVSTLAGRVIKDMEIHVRKQFPALLEREQNRSLKSPSPLQRRMMAALRQRTLHGDPDYRKAVRAFLENDAGSGSRGNMVEPGDRAWFDPFCTELYWELLRLFNASGVEADTYFRGEARDGIASAAAAEFRAAGAPPLETDADLEEPAGSSVEDGDRSPPRPESGDLRSRIAEFQRRLSAEDSPEAADSAIPKWLQDLGLNLSTLRSLLALFRGAEYPRSLEEALDFLDARARDEALSGRERIEARLAHLHLTTLQELIRIRSSKAETRRSSQADWVQQAAARMLEGWEGSPSLRRRYWQGRDGFREISRELARRRIPWMDVLSELQRQARGKGVNLDASLKSLTVEDLRRLGALRVWEAGAKIPGQWALFPVGSAQTVARALEEWQAHRRGAVPFVAEGEVAQAVSVFLNEEQDPSAGQVPLHAGDTVRLIPHAAGGSRDLQSDLSDAVPNDVPKEQRTVRLENGSLKTLSLREWQVLQLIGKQWSLRRVGEYFGSGGIYLHQIGIRLELEDKSYGSVLALARRNQWVPAQLPRPDKKFQALLDRLATGECELEIDEDPSWEYGPVTDIVKDYYPSSVSELLALAGRVGWVNPAAPAVKEAERALALNPRLTPMEYRILQAFARGWSVARICEVTQMTPGAVYAISSLMIHKFIGTGTTAQLLDWAEEQGLVSEKTFLSDPDLLAILERLARGQLENEINEDPDWQGGPVWKILVRYRPASGYLLLAQAAQAGKVDLSLAAVQCALTASRLVPPLSTLQYEMIQILNRGWSQTSAATALGTSTGTIRNLLNHISKKYRLPDGKLKTVLAWAREKGIVPSDEALGVDRREAESTPKREVPVTVAAGRAMRAGDSFIVRFEGGRRIPGVSKVGDVGDFLTNHMDFSAELGILGEYRVLLNGHPAYVSIPLKDGDRIAIVSPAPGSGAGSGGLIGKALLEGEADFNLPDGETRGALTLHLHYPFLGTRETRVYSAQPMSGRDEAEMIAALEEHAERLVRSHRAAGRLLNAVLSLWRAHPAERRLWVDEGERFDGAGASSVVAISERHRGDAVAYFHEIAHSLHARGLLLPIHFLSALRDGNSFERRMNDARSRGMEMHYALREFQQEAFPEEDRALKRRIRGGLSEVEIESMVRESGVLLAPVLERLREFPGFLIGREVEKRRVQDLIQEQTKRDRESDSRRAKRLEDLSPAERAQAEAVAGILDDTLARERAARENPIEYFPALDALLAGMLYDLQPFDPAAVAAGAVEWALQKSRDGNTSLGRGEGETELLGKIAGDLPSPVARLMLLRFYGALLEEWPEWPPHRERLLESFSAVLVQGVPALEPEDAQAFFAQAASTFDRFAENPEVNAEEAKTFFFGKRAELKNYFVEVPSRGAVAFRDDFEERLLDETDLDLRGKLTELHLRSIYPLQIALSALVRLLRHTSGVKFREEMLMRAASEGISGYRRLLALTLVVQSGPRDEPSSKESEFRSRVVRHLLESGKAETDPKNLRKMIGLLHEILRAKPGYDGPVEAARFAVVLAHLALLHSSGPWMGGSRGTAIADPRDREWASVASIASKVILSAFPSSPPRGPRSLRTLQRLRELSPSVDSVIDMAWMRDPTPAASEAQSALAPLLGRGYLPAIRAVARRLEGGEAERERLIRVLTTKVSPGEIRRFLRETASWKPARSSQAGLARPGYLVLRRYAHRKKLLESVILDESIDTGLRLHALTQYASRRSAPSSLISDAHASFAFAFLARILQEPAEAWISQNLQDPGRIESLFKEPVLQDEELKAHIMATLLVMARLGSVKAWKLEELAADAALARIDHSYDNADFRFVFGRLLFENHEFHPGIFYAVAAHEVGHGLAPIDYIGLTRESLHELLADLHARRFTEAVGISFGDFAEAMNSGAHYKAGALSRRFNEAHSGARMLEERIERQWRQVYPREKFDVGGFLESALPVHVLRALALSQPFGAIVADWLRGFAFGRTAVSKPLVTLNTAREIGPELKALLSPPPEEYSQPFLSGSVVHSIFRVAEPARAGNQDPPAAMAWLKRIVAPEASAQEWVEKLAPRWETGIFSILHFFTVWWGLPALLSVLNLDLTLLDPTLRSALLTSLSYLVWNFAFGISHEYVYVRNPVTGEWEVETNPDGTPKPAGFGTRLRLFGWALAIHSPLLLGLLHPVLGIGGVLIAILFHTAYNRWSSLALAIATATATATEEAAPLIGPAYEIREFAESPEKITAQIRVGEQTFALEISQKTNEDRTSIFSLLGSSPLYLEITYKILDSEKRLLVEAVTHYYSTAKANLAYIKRQEENGESRVLAKVMMNIRIRDLWEREVMDMATLTATSVMGLAESTPAVVLLIKKFGFEALGEKFLKELRRPALGREGSKGTAKKERVYIASQDGLNLKRPFLKIYLPPSGEYKVFLKDDNGGVDWNAQAYERLAELSWSELAARISSLIDQDRIYLGGMPVNYGVARKFRPRLKEYISRLPPLRPASGHARVQDQIQPQYRASPAAAMPWLYRFLKFLFPGMELKEYIRYWAPLAETSVFGWLYLLTVRWGIPAILGALSLDPAVAEPALRILAYVALNLGFGFAHNKVYSQDRFGVWGNPIEASKGLRFWLSIKALFIHAPILFGLDHFALRLTLSILLHSFHNVIFRTPLAMVPSLPPGPKFKARSPGFPDLGVPWVGFSNRESPQSYQAFWKRFCELLQKEAGRPLRIVDLGAGTNDLSMLTTRNFERAFFKPQLTVVDSQPVSLEGVDEAHRVEMENLDLFPDDFPAGEFDAIVSQHGVEYSRLEASMSQIGRILRPGGRAAFVVHNPMALTREDIERNYHELSREKERMIFALETLEKQKKGESAEKTVQYVLDGHRDEALARLRENPEYSRETKIDDADIAEYLRVRYQEIGEQMKFCLNHLDRAVAQVSPLHVWAWAVAAGYEIEDMKALHDEDGRLAAYGIVLRKPIDHTGVMEVGREVMELSRKVARSIQLGDFEGPVRVFNVNGTPVSYETTNTEIDSKGNRKKVYRIGPKILVALESANEGRAEEFFESQLRGVKDGLGSEYEKYKDHLAFIPFPGFGPYTTDIMVGMAAHQEYFQDSVGLDFGSGQGPLAMVALALGAKRVVMLENDKKAAPIAREFLELNRWSEGPTADSQATFLAGDMAEYPIEDLRRIVGIRPRQKVFVLANIGYWQQYQNPDGRDTNDIAMDAALELKAGLIVNGGHDISGRELKGYSFDVNEHLTRKIEKTQALIKRLRDRGYEVSTLFSANYPRAYMTLVAGIRPSVDRVQEVGQLLPGTDLWKEYEARNGRAIAEVRIVGDNLDYAVNDFNDQVRHLQKGDFVHLVVRFTDRATGLVRHIAIVDTALNLKYTIQNILLGEIDLTRHPFERYFIEDQKNRTIYLARVSVDSRLRGRYLMREIYTRTERLLKMKYDGFLLAAIETHPATAAFLAHFGDPIRSPPHAGLMLQAYEQHPLTHDQQVRLRWHKISSDLSQSPSVQPGGRWPWMQGRYDRLEDWIAQITHSRLIAWIAAQLLGVVLFEASPQAAAFSLSWLAGLAVGGFHPILPFLIGQFFWHREHARMENGFLPDRRLMFQALLGRFGERALISAAGAYLILTVDSSLSFLPEIQILRLLFAIFIPHLAVNAVIGILSWIYSRIMIYRVRSFLRSWQDPNVLGMVIFGSVARGTAGLGSDLDFLLIKQRAGNLLLMDPADMEFFGALQGRFGKWVRHFPPMPLHFESGLEREDVSSAGFDPFDIIVSLFFVPERYLEGIRFLGWRVPGRAFISQWLVVSRDAKEERRLSAEIRRRVAQKIESSAFPAKILLTSIAVGALSFLSMGASLTVASQLIGPAIATLVFSAVIALSLRGVFVSRPQGPQRASEAVAQARLLAQFLSGAAKFDPADPRVQENLLAPIRPAALDSLAGGTLQFPASLGWFNGLAARLESDHEFKEAFMNELRSGANFAAGEMSPEDVLGRIARSDPQFESGNVQAIAMEEIRRSREKRNTPVLQIVSDDSAEDLARIQTYIAAVQESNAKLDEGAAPAQLVLVPSSPDADLSRFEGENFVTVRALGGRALSPAWLESDFRAWLAGSAGARAALSEQNVQITLRLPKEMAFSPLWLAALSRTEIYRNARILALDLLPPMEIRDFRRILDAAILVSRSA